MLTGKKRKKNGSVYRVAAQLKNILLEWYYPKLRWQRLLGFILTMISTDSPVANVSVAMPALLRVVPWSSGRLASQDRTAGLLDCLLPVFLRNAILSAPRLPGRPTLYWGVSREVSRIIVFSKTTSYKNICRLPKLVFLDVHNWPGRSSTRLRKRYLVRLLYLWQIDSTVEFLVGNSVWCRQSQNNMLSLSICVSRDCPVLRVTAAGGRDCPLVTCWHHCNNNQRGQSGW